jgi:hypothetical protein
MTENKNINFKGFILLMILVIIGCQEISAQGWIYDFAGKSIAELETEGFEFTNFREDIEGVTTENIKDITAVAKTPYWLLGEEDYFTFSGARLSSAAGNGDVVFTIKMEKLDGTVVASETYNMQDAATDQIPQFDFSIFEKGFYRIVLEVSYTGNKKNVELTLQSFESNLPPETYTPDEAQTSIEIYSNVLTDKLEYYQTEPADISFKVFFEGIDAPRPIKRVRYQLLVPDGFSVTEATFTPTLKNGAAGLRTKNTFANEQIVLEEVNGDWFIVIEESNTDREVDIFMDAIATGNPGGYQMESNLEEADPGYVNPDPNAETPAIIIVPFGTQPVELIFFEALSRDQDVVLRWATTLEIENDYFAIERSRDGKNFLEIGRVEGHGNYSGRKDYTYTDHSVAGIYYYRLKQVDYDGSFSYSEVQRVSNSLQRKFTYSIFPNPSRDKKIALSMSDVNPDDQVQVMVVDMMGAVVRNLTITQPSPLAPYFMDLNDLREGTYLMRIMIGKEKITERILLAGN